MGVWENLMWSETYQKISASPCIYLHLPLAEWWWWTSASWIHSVLTEEDPELAHRHLLHEPCPLSDSPASVTTLSKHNKIDIPIPPILFILLALVADIGSTFMLMSFLSWYKKNRAFIWSLLPFCFGIMRSDLLHQSSATLWQKRTNISIAAKVSGVFVTTLLWKSLLGSRCFREDIVPAKHGLVSRRW